MHVSNNGQNDADKLKVRDILKQTAAAGDPTHTGELRPPRSRSYVITKEKTDEIALQTGADLMTRDASETEKRCRTFEILVEPDPTTTLATSRPREGVGGTPLDAAPKESQLNRTRTAPASPPGAKVEGHGRLHPTLSARCDARAHSSTIKNQRHWKDEKDAIPDDYRYLEMETDEGVLTLLAPHPRSLKRSGASAMTRKRPAERAAEAARHSARGCLRRATSSAGCATT